VLVTEDAALAWHPSLGEEGFGPVRRVPKARDEEHGPALVFADGTESIYLADMCGDGLNDLVRIRNGEICYWPNLGYASFGPKVTMAGAPWFDTPDQFDERRLRLADTDGSGTTDIIYLHGDGPRLYFNQSGNGWSQPRALSTFPRIDNVGDVRTLDLLGIGTACLVWSSPLPGDARRPMRYIVEVRSSNSAAGVYFGSAVLPVLGSALWPARQKREKSGRRPRQKPSRSLASSRPGAS
jgi:hypothetical protein